MRIFSANQKKAQKTVIDPFIDFEKVDQGEVSTAAPIFITGVGRSGTHFLARLFEEDQRFSAYHLDEVGNATADSFLMYAKWNELSIDYEGFFKARNFLIKQAHRSGKVYLEANPYLVFFAKELLDYYPKARVIHVIRDPRDVVLSHLNKGWYKDYYPSFSDGDRAPFYQYEIKQPNHFFGRVFPKEKEAFNKWSELTQVGKISWMWGTFNTYIRESIMNSERAMELRIDEFSFGEFQSLLGWLDMDCEMSHDRFLEVKEKRPGKTTFKKHSGWSDTEEEEFIAQTKLFANGEG